MRKLYTIFIVTILAFMPVEKSMAWGGSNNLYDMYSEKAVTKVYVSDISDSSGKYKGDLSLLKKSLENAIRTRMTINFEIVPEKSESDIFISCDIVEFFWTMEGPVDKAHGIPGILFNVIMPDDYTRMQAVFAVYNTKQDTEIWYKRVNATIKDKDMTPQESLASLNARLVKMFMRDCFNKNSQRNEH